MLKARDLDLVSAMLFETNCIAFGKFIVYGSGAISPLRIDLRLLVSYPDYLRDVAKKMNDVCRNLQFQRIAGVPIAGYPIATAIALKGNYKIIFLLTKQHPAPRKVVFGVCELGETVLIVNDSSSPGDDVLETIGVIKKERDSVVKDVVVFLDYDQGGAKNLADEGYTLHSVVNLKDVLKSLYKQRFIYNEDFNKSMEYLKG